MTTLPMEVRKDGFVLNQVWRSGCAAVYAQSRPGRDPVAWETVAVQVSPAEIIMGRSYPEREVYPGPEQWGTNAWTYLSLDAAMAKATSL